MPVQCPKCNSLNGDTARFCSSCGEALLSDSEKSKAVLPGIFSSRTKSTVSQATSESLQAIAIPAPLGPPEKINSLTATPVEVPGRLLRRHWWTGVPLHQGVVTFLHAWQGPFDKRIHPNWVFNLQKTDRHWQPLKDRNSLLLPVVEVEFRVEAVHGPPIEEGSQVLVEGKRRRKKIEAVHIWNFSPGRMLSTSGRLEILKGQVTNWEGGRYIPDMRYPGQGRQVEVWGFRLRCIDTQGNLLQSVPVEIRAESIEGTLRNGDQVEVEGQVVAGTLYAQAVKNLSLAGTPAVVVRGSAGIPLT